MSSSTTITRLQPEHAAAVVDCFRRVYGDTYANPLFYEAAELAQALATKRLCSVGALTGDGRIVGHMAMSLTGPVDTPELGNTVVDPEARGSGIAWQIGAELTAWCRELGFVGFLHYPTTGHHIMQRQSVERGFETGLMLGYIPAETHGKVGTADKSSRHAATIVYEPLNSGDARSSYLGGYGAELIRSFAESCQLRRSWLTPDRSPRDRSSAAEMTRLPSRGLARSTVRRVGRDVDSVLDDLEVTASPCLQIDFLMNDSGIEFGVEAARQRGFFLCGWLPDFRSGDVLRLQKPRIDTTNMTPDLVNDTARKLLHWIAR